MADVNEAGICRVCGCEDDIACPEGCTWVNRQRDLCSTCLNLSGAQRTVLEELWRRNRAQPGAWIACGGVAAQIGTRPTIVLMLLLELQRLQLVVRDGQSDGWMTHAAHERHLLQEMSDEPSCY